MAKSDLRIDVLGTSVSISTDEDPDYLSMLLGKYRRTIENVQRVSGIKDPLKTAVLTGFLLSDDLEKAGIAGRQQEQSSSEDSGEAERLTLGMISRLDEMVLTTSPEQTIQIYPASIFRLQNPVKNYEWGSPEWLPFLLGKENPGRIPWAELWVGVHPAGPSRVILPGTEGPNESEAGPLLSELLAQDETLPFLLKVIAAANPLSIQAHPNREQAHQGFDRENEAGIPLDGQNRNYRDSNHKPEIICALGPFVALVGFRAIPEICFLMEILSQGIPAQGSEGAPKGDLEKLIYALEEKDENPYKAFLKALYSIDSHELGLFIKKRQVLLERDFPEYQGEWKLCSYLADLYPGDPGSLAPLFLNIMELKAGQAMYIPAGVLHSYLHGMGIELQTNSDNVLRGGLTSKRVDREELFSILDFSEHKPEIWEAPDPALSWFSYPAKSGEFVLSVMQGTGNSIPYPETNPSIVIITQGNTVITEPGNQDLHLKTGESIFIPAGKKANLVFSGTFTAYVAARV